MAVIGLKHAGSPNVSRPDWPMHDIDRSELKFLAASQHISIDEVVERATATGMFTAITDDDDDASSRKVDDEPALIDHTRAELVEMATELGLELASKATKPQIAEAIETRLAEEAAAKAAAASSSGEGDQGGDGQPGSDPEASPSGEPGTPPSGDQA